MTLTSVGRQMVTQLSLTLGGQNPAYRGAMALWAGNGVISALCEYVSLQKMVLGLIFLSPNVIR